MNVTLHTRLCCYLALSCKQDKGWRKFTCNYQFCHCRPYLVNFRKTKKWKLQEASHTAHASTQISEVCLIYYWVSIRCQLEWPKKYNRWRIYCVYWEERNNTALNYQVREKKGNICFSSLQGMTLCSGIFWECNYLCPRLHLGLQREKKLMFKHRWQNLVP